MIKQHIVLNDQWNIIVYYVVDEYNINFIIEDLKKLKCSNKNINESIDILLNEYNTGMTYTNPKYRTTIVCISKYTSNDQFINTIVHESKHVQSHICNYFNIDEESEQAAYLIGYITQQMYKIFKNMLL